MSEHHTKPPHPVGTMSTHRIEALPDGVFAIVMTLLVFDLRVPEVPRGELPSALIALLPKFLAYATSFVLLGIYWVGHRSQFSFISGPIRTSIGSISCSSASSAWCPSPPAC